MAARNLWRVKTRAGKRTLGRRNAEQNPSNSNNARNFNPNNGNANNNNVNNQSYPLWVVARGSDTARPVCKKNNGSLRAFADFPEKL